MNDFFTIVASALTQLNIPAVFTLGFVLLVIGLFFWLRFKKLNLDETVSHSQMANQQIITLTQTMDQLGKQLSAARKDNTTLSHQNAKLVEQNQEMMKANRIILKRMERAEARLEEWEDYWEENLEHFKRAAPDMSEPPVVTRRKETKERFDGDYNPGRRGDDKLDKKLGNEEISPGVKMVRDE